MSKPPKSFYLRTKDEYELVRLFGAGHPEIEKRADIILSLVKAIPNGRLPTASA